MHGYILLMKLTRHLIQMGIFTQTSALYRIYSPVYLVVCLFVLGRGKGTPMLREGVTCIGVERVEDESEYSDWQGFE